MPKRILIVDDSPTSRMWQQMMLAGERYEILTAHDGVEGCETASAVRPDLILLDVVMPAMDGFAACRRMRREMGMAEVPIIMVTTQGEAWSVEQGYESGCTDYITKPIDRLEFLAKVRSHLGEGAP